MARGYVEVGLVIPAGYSLDLTAGRDVSVDLVTAGTPVSSAVRTTVERAVADQAALVRAARFTAELTGVPFQQALATARASAAQAAGVGVGVESVASSTTTSGTTGFDLGAQSQVILFMFLTALTGAVELITTRQLGISRRMLATPTGPWTIIVGEGLARVLISLFQGTLIVVASALLFGVNWTDPIVTAAIVVAFALVSGGAALLVGTLASNTSQAGALGPALGMLLGLLGGTMVPAEVFPDVMRTISHVTPHAWAMDAFRAVSLHGAGLVDVLPQLAVLLGFAAVLLTVSVVRFRRVLLSGG